MPGTVRAGTAVAWPATLAAKRGDPLHADHLRFRKRAGTPRALHCFVLDCSASMLSHNRLALAKGLIVAYFDQAARDRVETALICFGGNGAARRFGPAVPRWWNARWLEPVDGGGGTPLADGISAAAQLLAGVARRTPDRQRWLWVLSDGRTRETPSRPTAADHVVFVDFDDAAVRIGQGRRLADAWDAQWMTAASLCPGPAG
ncbi:vWA domain-containing protein [Burkholderia sp. LA-2-3-30-S1-D2]|uniref:vWA domain-containing protein n=1 Tax=Burkholderia sp. LA-2-3-30-S1-D2 TaxID=1637862 RepID=UPI00075B30D7|nr:VWA domain-containing protein [Burkholderia sp. LA-2-3-30-S1-D2]AOI97996.1 magnesium chelatase [Burkholderia sp. LA-2-3-30-S1-D2]KVE12246.1 magnesium chelatase [Burkholderia sp. LA-2-3-30-S1-D2]